MHIAALQEPLKVWAGDIAKTPNEAHVRSMAAAQTLLMLWAVVSTLLKRNTYKKNHTQISDPMDDWAETCLYFGERLPISITL